MKKNILILFLALLSAISLFASPWPLKCTATASSMEKGKNQLFSPSAAVDGKRSTRWSSAFTDDEWFQVDLGEIRVIERVIIHWQASAAAIYDLQISTDGETFRTIKETTKGKGGYEVLIFPSCQARYVRMLGKKRLTPYGYSIREFEVYPAIFGVGENLAAGKRCSTGIGKGEHATDGNHKTQWRTGRQQDHDFLTIDFGKEVTVGKAILRWGKEIPQEYKLQYSADGGKFFDLCHRVTEIKAVDTVIFTPQAMRFLRFQGVKSHGGGYSICELEAYETEFGAGISLEEGQKLAFVEKTVPEIIFRIDGAPSGSQLRGSLFSPEGDSTEIITESPVDGDIAGLRFSSVPVGYYELRLELLNLGRRIASAGYSFAVTPEIQEYPREMGLCIHDWQMMEDGMMPYELIRIAGFSRVRDGFSWHSLEPEKGKYMLPQWTETFLDKCERNNLRPLMVVTYSNRKVYPNGIFPGDRRSQKRLCRSRRFRCQSTGREVTVAARKSVAVDGSLDEWRADEFITLDQIMGWKLRDTGTPRKEDFNVKAGIRYDESNLYCAFLVEDDDLSLCDSVSRDWRDNDNLRIFLSTENEEKRGREITEKELLFILSPTDGKHEKGPIGFSAALGGHVRPGFEKNVRMASHVWSGGYAVEVGIPWKSINVIPKPGLKLGFNLLADDADNGFRTHTAMLTAKSFEYWKAPITLGTLILE